MAISSDIPRTADLLSPSLMDGGDAGHEEVEAIGVMPLPPELRDGRYDISLADEKKKRRRRLLLAAKRAVASCVTGATIIGTHVGISIGDEYEKWSGVPSQIIEVADANDPADQSRLFAGNVGFGMSDASDMMRSLGSLRDGGRLVAEKYSDNGINTDESAEELVEFAKHEHIHEIIPVGHSIGGLVALNKAAKMREIIKEQGLDIQVPKVILLQTPYSIDSVRSDMRYVGQDVCRYAEYAPWLRYYWPLRFAPELYSRQQSYRNQDGSVEIGQLLRTAHDVYETKIAEPTATTKVIYDQYCVQLGATGSGALNRIGRTVTDTNPFEIEYYNPHDTTTDHVVDSTVAYPMFERGAKKNGIVIHRYDLPDIGHDSPGQVPQAFNDVLERTVMQELAAEKRRHLLVTACLREAFKTGETSLTECIAIARHGES